MKSMRRSVSILLALTMILSVGITAFAELIDISTHWANKEINYFVEKGILNGYPDGTFKPENNVTKAEIYTIINKVIGYTNVEEVNFLDVKESDWFFQEVAKGVKAGYITENPGVNLMPNTTITREEVATIVGIAFGLSKDASNSAKYFLDEYGIEPNAKGYISILKDKGYISGYSDGTFKPNGLITRAEAAKMINNISGEIINTAGSITKDVEGNLLINTADVILKDMQIKGDLYLTEGIGNGDVTLDNVVVKGETYIRGGGENSVIIKDSTLGRITIDRSGGIVRVIIEGNISIDEIILEDNAILVVREGATVGIVHAVGKATIQVDKGATIKELDVSGKEVDVKSEGKIDLIVANEKVKVNGETINKGTEAKVENGKIEEIVKDEPKKDSGSSGGGGGDPGGGPGGETKVLVTGITVNPTTMALTVGAAGTIIPTVSPANATIKSVTWTSSNTGVATVGATGKVTALAAGTATITAKTVDGGKMASCTIQVRPESPTITSLDEQTDERWRDGILTKQELDSIEGEHAGIYFDIHLPESIGTGNYNTETGYWVYLYIKDNDGKVFGTIAPISQEDIDAGFISKSIPVGDLKNYLQNFEEYNIYASIFIGENFDLESELSNSVKIVYIASEDTKIIKNVNELVEAVNNQKSGETWFIKNGIYNTPRFDNITPPGGQTGWYFPIATSNITIIGESKEGVVLTSDVVSPNGAWASQDHISVWGDNVTIKNLTIKPKITTNKTIEVMGKNFSLIDVDFVQRGDAPFEFAGSLYFNPTNSEKSIGDVLVENVLINDAWISAGSSTVLAGKLMLKNTTIDFRGSAYAPLGYGVISKNDNVISVVQGSYFKVHIDNTISDIQTLAIDRVPVGGTVELDAGTYYNLTGQVPTTRDGVTLISNGAKFVKADKIISSTQELNHAIQNQTDGETWIIRAGTYDIPRNTTTLRDNEGKVVDAGGQSGWYMPITANNLTIIGLNNPIITSSEVVPNGSWASQNLITVWGDNVTLKGLVITPKVDVNKSVEVVGDVKFTIEDCSFVPNTIATGAPKNRGGSLYFSGSGLKGSKEILVKNNTFNYTTLALDGIEGSNILITGNTWENIADGAYAIGNTYWGSAERKTTQYADVNVYGNNFNNIPDGTRIIAARLNQTFKLDTENKINGEKINKNDFSKYINFNNLAYWPECKNNKVIIDDVTYESPYNDVDFYVTNVQQLNQAINNAVEGNLIFMAAGEYKLDSKIIINKSVTIDGNGAIIKADNVNWSTSNENKHLIGVYSKDVSIRNITLDSNMQAYGVQYYKVTGGNLENVNLKNSKGAGLTVNGSTVVAIDLTTSGNAWGAVNVDPGSGVTNQSVFTLEGGTLGEDNQIWSDGRYVINEATVSVDAIDYKKYQIGTTTIWTNRELENVATIEKGGKTTIYNTIQAAIEAAEVGETINVATGNYTITETINVNKAVTIKGAPDFATKIITSGGSSVFNLSAAATLDSIFIDKTDKTGQHLVKITANDTVIKDCKFIGRYAQGEGDVARAIVPNAGTTGYMLTGNHFESLRQPAYLEGTGTVINNFVKNTRGWVVCVNYEVTFIDNTFEGNAVDIAIIANNQTESEYYKDVAAISEANNGAYVENQLLNVSAINGELVVKAKNNDVLENEDNIIELDEETNKTQDLEDDFSGQLNDQVEDEQGNESESPDAEI